MPLIERNRAEECLQEGGYKYVRKKEKGNERGDNDEKACLS